MPATIRTARAAWMFIAAVCALMPACGCSREAARDPNAPALYVLAPDADAAGRASILPPEAALRATTVELAARGMRVAYVPVSQLGAFDPAAYPRLVLRPEADGAAWSATLRRSAEKSADLGRLAFEVDSWGKLVASSSNASAALVAALERELKVPARPAARELTAEERALLGAAFAAVCTDGPAAALEAAALVDKALTASPSSAEARCGAAWPAAILGSADLHGHMHLRGRYLAVPLGWWVAARNGSGTAGSRERLTEAWVALLCGFPNATLAAVDGLDKEAATQPLAKALRMFATRDYRPLTPDAGAATAVEQLAWTWALRECGLFSQYDDAAYKIMERRRYAGFGPVSGELHVGTGHLFTEAMATGATHSFIAAVATMDALPSGPRGILDTCLKAAAQAGAEGEPHLWPGASVRDCVGLLYRAKALAQAAPDGPTRRTQAGTDWQSLSPWAYAEVQSGLAYHALYLRGYFLSSIYGVPEEAVAFLNGVVAGLEKDIPAAGYFRLVAFTVKEHLVSGAGLSSLYGEELGIQPATWSRLSEWAGREFMNTVRRDMGVVHHPCGAWEGQSCWRGYDTPKVADKGKSWYRLAVGNDDYSLAQSRALTYQEAKPDDIRAIVARMPYCAVLAEELADEAAAAEQTDLAIELYSRCIESAGDLIDGYRKLADLHAARGDTAQAIEVLRKGCLKSQPSVGTGNAMSRLASLLLDSGKADEAVEWAQRGSQTYSGEGLSTYGRVLIAVGRVEEGLEYYRLNAERYDSGAFSYLVQMSVCKRPAGMVVSEAKRLAAMYPGTRTVNNIASALAMHGQFGEARGILSGEFGMQDARTRSRFLGLFALLENNFSEAAFKFGSAFADTSGFARDEDPYTLLQAYVAACLADDEALRNQAATQIRRYAGTDAAVLVISAYLKGECTREEAMRRTSANRYRHLNLCWLLGAECEAAGDPAKALDYYAHVAGYQQADWVFAGTGVRQRIKALEAQGISPRVESTDSGEAGAHGLH